MEPIRLSGDQLKELQSAIPFHPAAGEKPLMEPITPVIEPAAGAESAADAGSDPMALEPYRKKFRRKSGGDVVQGNNFGYDTDIIRGPCSKSRRPAERGAVDGDVSPL